MSKLVFNRNGGQTDEYGHLLALNRLLVGDVIQGLTVAANASPNMVVYVSAGVGRVTTGTTPGDYGYFVGIDTAAPGEAVTVATANSSARIDYIVAYVDLSVTPNQSQANNSNNMLKLASVAGTPSGSPVVPTVGQIQTAIGASNPYIILASVAVAALATQITNANISDARAFTADRNARALGAASYVDSGCVWTISSGLVGAMSAGTAFINVAGVMVPVNLAAIASNTFTASQDTYIYVNVLGVVGYLPVANNTTAPSLPANSVWVALVVTGASAITTVSALYGSNNPKAIVSKSGRVTTVSGWGVITPGAVNTGAQATAYGISFTSAPYVTVIYGGDNASLTTYGSGGVNIKDMATSMVHSITTTQFSVRFISRDASNWSAGNTIFYQWTASGIV